MSVVAICRPPKFSSATVLIPVTSVYLCFSFSLFQSSVKEPDAEGFLIESHCKDNVREGHLPHGLDPLSMLKHVAIVMDGTSLWAEKGGLQATAGHEVGRRAPNDIVKL